MKTIKYSTMISSSLSKIVKPRAIFMLFGVMGFTFLAEAQGRSQQKSNPYWIKVNGGWEFSPHMKRMNQVLDNIAGNPPKPSDYHRVTKSGARIVYVGKGDPRDYTDPGYTAPNSTPQRQSGRTLQWKTGEGQQLRLDRLYVGLDANLILKAFGRPDKVSWQYSTWTYQNLNIQNPLTGRQYRNVTFVVKNRKIQVASVH